MVALKLENSNPTAPYRNTKQERRGGIETRGIGWAAGRLGSKQERRGGIETLTAPLPDCRRGAKQERRGGIETGSRGEDSRQVLGGSRNAVVALKRLPPFCCGHSYRRSRNAVVALKLRQGGFGVGLLAAGSRNAVVALKPPDAMGLVFVPFLKQERRGGIETWAARIAHRIIGSKQERRGGIETLQRADVGLCLEEKQERRGGIETRQKPMGGGEDVGKQERRGGIETPNIRMKV